MDRRRNSTRLGTCSNLGSLDPGSLNLGSLNLGSLSLGSLPHL